MDIKQLRYFVAVAEERSVTQAAARLRMSQPPLSAQLARLEREVGARLFTRHRRGVDLTEAGRHLFARAVRLLRDVDEVAQSVRSVGQGATGRLALALVPSLAQTVAPPLLRRVTSEVPDLVLDVLETTPDELRQALHTRQVDAGLAFQGAGPGAAPGEGLDSAVVAREPLVAVLPPGPPVRDGELIDLADLAREPFVVPARYATPGLHSHVLAACRTAGFLPVSVRETRLVATLLGLVAGGLGVSVLPVSLARLGGDLVRAVPLRRPVHAVETVVLWRGAEEQSPVLRRLLRLALATPEPDLLGPGKGRRRTAGVEPG
jgi:DNA-binding transcriptional LysR family regulator